jgi:uncharacterized protein (TIGR03382 family)
MNMHRSMVVALSLLASAGSLASAEIHIFSKGGTDNASIQSTVDDFRAKVSLGGANNGVGGGLFTTGRREINWDAGALDAFAFPNNMPPDFFLKNSKRGALFSTPDGEGFYVSKRNANDPNDPLLRFGDQNATYNSEFGAFSQQRLFTVDGGIITDVTFRVPTLENVKATVNGFGAVFTDVDSDASTFMEFFDEGGNLLLSQGVSSATVSKAGMSFLGVVFDDARVARVRIHAGNIAPSEFVNDGDLISAGFTADVVAMDDFIYGEPIPAPGAITLAAAGLAGLTRRRRR